MDYSLPRGNTAYSARERDISMRNPAFVLEEGVVMRELEREQKLWMYESMDPHTKRLKNVKVWDSIWGGRPRYIHAKEATIGFEEDGQAWLALYDGKTYETASDNLQGFRVTDFDKQRVALDFTEALERNKHSAQRPKSMSIAGLKGYIQKKQAEAAEAKAGSFVIEQWRDAQAEYHKRFSIPFACLAFGLIGVPLGLIVKRSGKMVGFGIGLGLILVYYLLLQFGQGWVRRNSVVSPGFRHVASQYCHRRIRHRLQSAFDTGRKIARKVLSPRNRVFSPKLGFLPAIHLAPRIHSACIVYQMFLASKTLSDCSCPVHRAF